MEQSEHPPEVPAPGNPDSSDGSTRTSEPSGSIESDEEVYSHLSPINREPLKLAIQFLSPTESKWSGPEDLTYTTGEYCKTKHPMKTLADCDDVECKNIRCQCTTFEINGWKLVWIVEFISAVVGCFILKFFLPYFLSVSAGFLRYQKLLRICYLFDATVHLYEGQGWLRNPQITNSANSSRTILNSTRFEYSDLIDLDSQQVHPAVRKNDETICCFVHLAYTTSASCTGSRRPWGVHN